MNNSLGLSQSTVTCANVTVVSSKHAPNGRDIVSFPPVGRIHGGGCIAIQPKLRCLSATRNRFLGSRSCARGAHVGQGLGCVSNGSKWSAGTWLDNKYEFLTLCSFRLFRDVKSKGKVEGYYLCHFNMCRNVLSLGDHSMELSGGIRTNTVITKLSWDQNSLSHLMYWMISYAISRSGSL